MVKKFSIKNFIKENYMSVAVSEEDLPSSFVLAAKRKTKQGEVRDFFLCRRQVLGNEEMDVLDVRIVPLTMKAEEVRIGGMHQGYMLQWSDNIRDLWKFGYEAGSFFIRDLARWTKKWPDALVSPLTLDDGSTTPQIHARDLQLETKAADAVRVWTLEDFIEEIVKEMMANRLNPEAKDTSKDFSKMIAEIVAEKKSA